MISTTLIEIQDIHTRLLRLGLATDDSRAYWQNVDPSKDRKDIASQAFEERWFGAKSWARVEYLVFSLEARFQGAMVNLKAWDPSNPQDRRWVCHFHLQLTDPLYRLFTETYLNQRMYRTEPTVEKISSLEWLEDLAPGRWATSTAIRLVSGLSSCLTEAGFCQGKVTPRAIIIPQLSDEALAYLVYLLKNVEFEGQLFDNPYLRTTQLGADLERRLLKLPGFHYQRRGDVHSLDLDHSSFHDWISAQ